ncbi:protein HOTHEAD-like [Bidens hawaiensis]|uniref:protein HOTHEAD-like n=1 Tax=Bidens hawaiensis TaxID=980011 RepID=UPI00404B9BC3
MARAREIVGTEGRTGRRGRPRMVRQPSVESSSNTGEEAVAIAVKNLSPEGCARSHGRTVDRAEGHGKKDDEREKGDSRVVKSVKVDNRKRGRAPNYSFMHEATSAPKISFYDYIVVGGGAAGIPIATTLSENYSVLLLERGGSPYDNPEVSNAAYFGSYFYDTSASSPAELFMSEDGVGNVRPRVLGGGTSINAGLYTRDSDKFHKEAKLTDERLVNASFEYVEKVMVFEPDVGEWQLAWKDALIDAGVTTALLMIICQYANPLSLSVYLYATVTKILFTTQGGTTPRAYAVVFEDADGNTHRAYLKGNQFDEIILSAGPLGSPQLLMLSGIGPEDQLDALQIKVVLNQPLVGQGMADNPLNVLFVPSPIPVKTIYSSSCWYSVGQPNRAY